MARVINFNPGPAALPLPALETAQRELLDFQGSGLSILEHSHRGKEYDTVHNEALSLIRELLGVPDDYHVLFMQGGASGQFALLPMNFLPPGQSADYIVTGAWGKKAFVEANNVGKARLAWSGEDGGFVRLPEQHELDLDENAAYVHMTSNETIHGVQFREQFPDVGKVRLVCDMSSDFLSHHVDVTKFDMIYAGAQKNIGPAGVTVVIVKKDWVEQGRSDIARIFRYKTHADANSLANTAPTFAIYMVRNVLQWLKDVGGLDQMEVWNKQKSDLLYEFLDAHSEFYRCPVSPASRSQMNIVFRLPTEQLEKKLVAEAKEHGMVGLKGHRSVGGIRVSAYNAVTVESVRKLVDFLGNFAKDNG